MIPRIPFTTAIGLLLLNGTCHGLRIQQQQQQAADFHRHHRCMTIKVTSRNSRIITCFSTSQLDINVKTDKLIPIAVSDETMLDRRQLLINELGSSFALKILELEEFHRQNGHCLVPKRYENNPSLGNWVNKQRQNYRRHLIGESTTLNETRISALNKLGFVWNTTSIPLNCTLNENSWKKMYRQLVDFYLMNNNCNVPSSTALGQWVVRQRFLYRQQPTGHPKLSLSAERIEMLNDLKFSWLTRSENLWNERMRELRKFNEQHGHSLVPRNYPLNPQLSAWVATQRKNYKRKLDGKPSPLTTSRIKELGEIGFVWSYWDHNFMTTHSDQSLHID